MITNMFDTWLHSSQNEQKYVLPFLKVTFSSDKNDVFIMF